VPFLVFSSGSHLLSTCESYDRLRFRSVRIPEVFMSTTRTHSPSSPSQRRVSCVTPAIGLAEGAYQLRLAASESDRRAALRLRFLVFNLELNEGLDAAYIDGYDKDKFDDACDHLIVEHRRTTCIVGTYRVQTGLSAAANHGYYSEREFNFIPYERIRDSIVELGRACVHRDHRSTEVLYLLWRGIAQYALQSGARYLIGCSSLTSQDPAHGAAVYEMLAKYLTIPALRTVPHPNFAMPLADSNRTTADVPKLLRTYLAVGAKICGPPAIDREFKTIDFLTLMDLELLPPRVAARFLSRH
jgi:putative hemolysin